jgi:hypothetical protein
VNALPALNSERRSRAESQFAGHHGAGIGLLLTRATGDTTAFVVRCSDEVEDSVRSPVAGTVSLILAKILAILKIYSRHFHKFFLPFCS